jgi:quinol-cytochrome oxidoreductase complex cytochrome b subunit
MDTRSLRRLSGLNHNCPLDQSQTLPVTGEFFVAEEYYDKQKENKMNKSTISIALKGIAVAMGIAVIVLNILGTLTTETAINLLSIGLTALGIAALQK